MTDAFNQQIFIACASNQAFLPHTATMLCSVLENTDKTVKIFLLHNDIDPNDLVKLAEFIESYGSSLQTIKVTNIPHGIKANAFWNDAIYFRLLLQDVVPIQIEKIIYLDSDIIVRMDIEHLYSTDLKSHSLAAVEDSGWGIGAFERLDIPAMDKYFNSGVLVINLKKWRDDRIHEKVIQYIQLYPEKAVYPDQDGLNAVLHGDWIQMPFEWNVQHGFFYSEMNRIRYADIVEDPAIVHFSGRGIKPWDRDVEHPFKREYLEYRAKTPWPLQSVRDYLQLKKKIRKFIRNFIIRTYRVRFIYSLARKIKSVLDRTLPSVEYREDKATVVKDEQVVRQKISLLSPDYSVLRGPFQGLKYPGLESFGSALAPKILGSYESELHEVVEKVIAKNYSTIIDIGCGEGYYAIGFALRMQKAEVWAYDIDPDARKLCEQMAALNGVADRVHIDKTFTMRSLPNLSGENGFLLCDCEGAEEYIFYKDPKTWDLLTKNFDLLIEIHDVFRPHISAYLYDLFSTEYDIMRIFSTGDPLRPLIYHQFVQQGFSRDEQIMLFAEKRAGLMEWFYLKRKA